MQRWYAWSFHRKNCLLDYFLFGTGDEAKAKRLGYVSGGVNMYTLRTPNAVSDGTEIRIVNTSGTGG